MSFIKTFTVCLKCNKFEDEMAQKSTSDVARWHLCLALLLPLSVYRVVFYLSCASFCFFLLLLNDGLTAQVYDRQTTHSTH